MLHCLFPQSNQSGPALAMVCGDSLRALQLPQSSSPAKPLFRSLPKSWTLAKVLPSGSEPLGLWGGSGNQQFHGMDLVSF